MKKSPQELKAILQAQQEGLRKAYIADLKSLDTRRALANLRGVFALVPTLPLRQTSGLVQLQTLFRNFADEQRFRS